MYIKSTRTADRIVARVFLEEILVEAEPFADNSKLLRETPAADAFNERETARHRASVCSNFSIVPPPKAM